MLSIFNTIAIATVLAQLATTEAAPAPVPNGGVGVRANDTPPAYAAMSDCKHQGVQRCTIL